MSRRLTVHAADEAAEISVLDGSFDRVACGIGQVDAELPDGLYVIRVRVGPTFSERLVALDQDTVELFDRQEFPSPIPLARTSTAQRRHVLAAEEIGAHPRDDLGQGGTVMVFVRDPSGGNAERTPSNPATGLSLRRSDDPNGMHVDVAARSDVRLEGDACAGWSASVRPGPWILTLRQTDGTETERSIWVGQGNHVKIFLLRMEYALADGTSERVADLGRGAVVISPEPAFRTDDERTRLAELARYALTHDRRVLSERMLGQILAEKFDDAMLGLIGAHLLVRDRPGDRASLDIVLGNLTRILGRDNPDLQALALRAGSRPLPRQGLRHPPMLRAGWDALVETSVRVPDVIVEGSPAATVASRVLPGEPWLTWDAGSAEADRAKVLTGILDDYLTSRVNRAASRTAPAPASRSSPSPSRRTRSRIASRRLDRDDARPAGAERTTVPIPMKSSLALSLPDEEREELVRALGVPSGILSELLSKLSN